MQDGCVHANGYCVDEDAVELCQAEMLVHDAAAADALMLAIANKRMACSDREQHDVCVALDTVIRYADELMAEWGFDTGEDA